MEVKGKPSGEKAGSSLGETYWQLDKTLTMSSKVHCFVYDHLPFPCSFYRETAFL